MCRSRRRSRWFSGTGFLNQLSNNTVLARSGITDKRVGVEKLAHWRGLGAGVIFLRRTVADSRDLELRKRASRFKFWVLAARKNRVTEIVIERHFKIDR
jgi:hypothetical protein